MTDAGEPQKSPPTPKVAKILVRKLQGASSVLPVKFLIGAKDIQLTALNRGTGQVADRQNENSLTALKQTVRRNLGSDFIFVVRAGKEIGDQIRSALGPSVLDESLAGTTDIQIWFHGMNMAEPIWFQVRNQAVYAWNQVRVTWPRDPSGRYTLSRTGIMLIMPLQEMIPGIAPLQLLNEVPGADPLQ